MMEEEKAGSSDEDDQPFIKDFLGMEDKPEPTSPKFHADLQK